MNLPIGRFLGKGMHGHCDRVRRQCEEKFGGPEAVDAAVPRLRLSADAQRALPQELHAHREHRRRHRRARAAEQAADPRLLPVEVQGRRGGVRAAPWRSPATGNREPSAVRATLSATELRRRRGRHAEVSAARWSRRRSSASRASTADDQRGRHAEPARHGRGTRDRSAAGAR